MNGKTPAPVLTTGDEGMNTTEPTNPKETTMNNQTTQQHALIASISAYGCEFARQTTEAVRSVQEHPAFVSWAQREIERSPGATIERLARHYANEHIAVGAPLPDAHLPSGWRVCADGAIGGEATLDFAREVHDDERPEVRATLSILVSCVVDVDPARNGDASGRTVGDYFVSDLAASWGGVRNEHDADAAALRALARVLKRVADLTPDAEAFADALRAGAVVEGAH